MSEALLDTLHRERLDTPERIDRAVLQGGSIAQLLDLLSRLCDSIENMPVEPRTPIKPFVFFPASSIAAQWWPCQELACRLSRANRLARFAALWADSVYIPSYLSRYAHELPTEAEPWLRSQLANDLKVMLSLRPLIAEGIVRFFNPWVHFCEQCAREFDQRLEGVSSRLDRAKAQLRRQALDAVAVRVHVVAPAPSHEPFVCVDIEGPEDIVPHGFAAWTMSELPAWLPTTVTRRVGEGYLLDYSVPRSRLRQVDLIDRELNLVAQDLLTQHIMSSSVGAAYLTDRRVDAAFLNAIDASPEKARLNAALERYLSYDMPVIESVPLSEVLSLRRAEQDAFLVYRDTMTRLIREHLVSRGTISATEARDIYDAEVRPALNKLNARITAVRSTLSDKFRRNVAVSATILSLGFFGGLFGLVPQDAGAIFSAFGGAGLAKEVLDSLLKAVRPPDDLRGDNLYFLWKLGKRQS